MLCVWSRDETYKKLYFRLPWLCLIKIFDKKLLTLRSLTILEITYGKGRNKNNAVGKANSKEIVEVPQFWSMLLTNLWFDNASIWKLYQTKMKHANIFGPCSLSFLLWMEGSIVFRNTNIYFIFFSCLPHDTLNDKINVDLKSHNRWNKKKVLKT